MKQFPNNPRLWTDEDRAKLKANLQELGDISGIVHDENSDSIPCGNFRSDTININKCEIEIVKEFDEPDAQGTVALGFVIWEGNYYNYRRVQWTAEQCEKACITANALGGDFIGGAQNNIAKTMYLKRKAMNTFICSVDRPFKFIGRINEDVNTYTRLGSTGSLFYTIPLVAINQKTTQTNKGGMTDLYLDSGTYVKSFYSVMYQPSSVKILEMGSTNRRLHHNINWKCTTPYIVKE